MVSLKRSKLEIYVLVFVKTENIAFGSNAPIFQQRLSDAGNFVAE